MNTADERSDADDVDLPQPSEVARNINSSQPSEVASSINPSQPTEGASSINRAGPSFLTDVMREIWDPAGFAANLADWRELFQRPQESLLQRPSDMRDGDVNVGDIIVPLCAGSTISEERMAIRTKMNELGGYPGVEFVVEGVTVDGEAVGGVTRGDAEPARTAVTIRPAFPLVARLEREWPVTVPLFDRGVFPLVVSKAAYNSITVAASAVFAVAPIVFVLLVRPIVSFYIISDTLSMQPVLQTNDVLLVEKVTPRFLPPRRDEIVLFSSPPALDAVIQKYGGKPPSPSSLFVKRVVAVAGDVDKDGVPLSEGTLWVQGDNRERSTDSRMWGELPEEFVKGRPFLRIFPPDRIGPVR